MAPTSFLDLPSEIRNNIYELELQGQHRLRLVKPLHSQRCAPLVKPGYPSPVLSPALLRSCRQVNSDATRIFYSKIKMEICASALQTFVTQIGNSARYIKRIKVDYIDNNAKTQLEPLKAAIGLELLEVSVHDAAIRPKQFSEAIMPWFKATLAGNRSRDNLRKVLDVLKIEISGSGYQNYITEIREREARQAREYEEEVRINVLFQLIVKMESRGDSREEYFYEQIEKLKERVKKAEEAEHKTEWARRMAEAARHKAEESESKTEKETSVLRKQMREDKEDELKRKEAIIAQLKKRNEKLKAELDESD